MERDDISIEVAGRDVTLGKAVVSEVKGTADGRVVVDLSFKPSWPGIWHAQALAVDDLE